MPAPTSDAVTANRPTAAPPARLAVAWQHPTKRLMEPIGLLACTEDGYRFDYLARAAAVDGFQPLLGFPDLGRSYTAERLFPLFGVRVMRRRRPDFAEYVRLLGLHDGSGEWELLARSTGERHGDDIRAFAEPHVAPDGSTNATFFVSGVRHRLAQDRTTVEAALSAMQPDEQLQIVSQPDNPQNPRALLVAAASGVGVGWVPHVLLDYVHHVASRQALVQQVAAADAVPSYRLLVRLMGQAEPGYVPFDGPAWRLAKMDMA